jgi:class 3 adenylate cyclase/tetratricopeptide (TPR) repeat protein
MKCSQCQHENPLGSNFCLGCGTRLGATCGACGNDLPAGSRFCNKCGTPVSDESAKQGRFASPESYTPKHLAERILTSKSALEGERKQVTVLFVDVSGFTSISDRLDPEDVHGLITRAFELMLAEVHRYEGTVNQFLGDGIMALFGAPIAHEDHAQRAVHSALGIQRTLESYRNELERRRGIRFRVRQGLNTGLVVVGSIGSDLRMDYTAVGDTTNVAARMLQIADAGRVVIAEATHRLVGDYFHTRPLGGLTLKGKTEPVHAWEVISPRSARTRLDVEAERGLTPFVGRDRELRVLTECFDKVTAGLGQVVFVVGEPGIGKSRLLLEFQRHLGERATWVEGRSMSFGRSIAFHPLIDLLRRTFRIEESDQDSAIIEKIERGVLRLGTDLRSTLPYLRHLLGVDSGDPAVQAMDPQLRRAEVFEAVRRLLLRAAEVWPQVVVYEDVHWMDQATEEFLGLMADIIATSRVLMILTYRPGYVPPFGDRSYYTRLVLTALSTEASAAMTRGMLATERLPDTLQTLIAAKAEGNPFFVEEVVKSLQEIGAIRLEHGHYVLTRLLDDVVVPDTIQDVIMARIDRLAEAPKKTLQLASVIGREFTRRLLDRISDIRGQTEHFLRELKGIELIYEKSLFPELAYMFKHALTHDVAYNSLLVQRRKELHQLIAMAVEELYADRLADQYEVLAHHFSKAEDWRRALDYLVKAAEKAAQGFANHEALALYQQALDVAAHLGEAVPAKTVMAIHQARSDIYMVTSDFVRAHEEGERVLVLARQAGDQVTTAMALGGMALASLFGHAFERGLGHAREAISLAQAADIRPALARAHIATGWVHLVHGRLETADQEFARAREVSQGGNDPFFHAFSIGLTGELKNFRGEFIEASALQSEALRIAREHNLVFPMLFTLFAEGITRTGMGDYTAARALFEEGRALATKVGDEIWLHRLLNCQGWYYIELWDLERATQFNREGAAGARKRGDPETAANAEANLGDIFIAQGDLNLAHDVLEGVHRVIDDPAVSEWQKWRYSMHVFACLADLWLARSDLDKARAFTEQCLEVATRTMSRKYLVRGWRLRGEIAFASREWDESEAALRQALTIAESIGNPTQLWKTHAALGALYAALRRPEASSKAYRSAVEVVDRIKASVDDPKLAETLSKAPPVRELYQRSGPA